MGRTGFSDPYGSWKTAWMSLVSARRLRGLSRVTSAPSKVMVPEATGTSPSTALPSVDLPEPLSPTSATVSPGAMASVTSRSAVNGGLRRPRR